MYGYKLILTIKVLSLCNTVNIFIYKLGSSATVELQLSLIIKGYYCSLNASLVSISADERLIPLPSISKTHETSFKGFFGNFSKIE